MDYSYQYYAKRKGFIDLDETGNKVVVLYTTTGTSFLMCNLNLSTRCAA